MSAIGQEQTLEIIQASLLRCDISCYCCVMKNIQNKLGYLGVALGAVALILALVHFWAGPFSPQPTFETAIADKVSAIRESTINALKGEEYRETITQKWHADRVIELSVALMGALAIILGIVAFIQKAPRRLAGGAAVLGAGAIGFQMFTFYIGVLLIIIVISAVLSEIGLDFSF